MSFLILCLSLMFFMNPFDEMKNEVDSINKAFPKDSVSSVKQKILSRMKDLYSENDERLWDSDFIYENKVCMHPSGRFYYSGKYQLDSKDTDLRDGDWIGILKSEKSRRPVGEITE